MAGGDVAAMNGAPNGATRHRAGAGAALHEWLVGASWSVGALQCYLDFLEENFDSPEQLSEIYSRQGPDGRRAFDFAQFFEDVGVEDPAHRCLFECWFSTGSSAPSQPPASAAPSRAGAVGAEPPGHGVAAGQAPAEDPSRRAGGDCQGSGGRSGAPAPADRGRSAPATSPAPTAGGRPGVSGQARAVEDWLGSVDWSAGLLTQYRRQFEANFDDPVLYPNQIRDAYVLDRGDKQVFDEASFFGDLGIEDAGHRELFRAWFAEQFGAVRGPAG